MTDKTTSKLLGRLKLPANCRVVTIGTVIGVVGAEAMRPQPDVPVSPSTSPAMKPLGKTGLMVPASWINKTEEAMRTGTIFGIVGPVSSTEVGR
jgi:hypothetical protein